MPWRSVRASAPGNVTRTRYLTRQNTGRDLYRIAPRQAHSTRTLSTAPMFSNVPCLRRSLTLGLTNWRSDSINTACLAFPFKLEFERIRSGRMPAGGTCATRRAPAGCPASGVGRPPRDFFGGPIWPRLLGSSFLWCRGSIHDSDVAKGWQTAPQHRRFMSPWRRYLQSPTIHSERRPPSD